MILLEDVIAGNMDKLFLSYDILCVHPYRIMRNADLTIDEDEASDLLEEIQKQLKKRQWGEVIRLEVDEKVDKASAEDPEKRVCNQRRWHIPDWRTAGSDFPDEDVRTGWI